MAEQEKGVNMSNLVYCPESTGTQIGGVKTGCLGIRMACRYDLGHRGGETAKMAGRILGFRAVRLQTPMAVLS